MFAPSGTNLSWQYLSKISPAITFLRAAKERVAFQISSVIRSKAHTTPSAEEDIAKLTALYVDSRVYDVIPEREVDKEDTVKDYVTQGSNKLLLSSYIQGWWERRATRQAEYEMYIEADGTFSDSDDSMGRSDD